MEAIKDRIETVGNRLSDGAFTKFKRLSCSRHIQETERSMITETLINLLVFDEGGNINKDKGNVQ